MSVYSGFCKRNQEELYDALTLKLLQLMNTKIIELLSANQDDNKCK